MDKLQYATKTAASAAAEILALRAELQTAYDWIASVANTSPAMQGLVRQSAKSFLFVHSKGAVNEWPTSERIDAIGPNGNTGEHYVFTIGHINYRLNPHGRYALYEHVTGTWRESQGVTNEMLNSKGESNAE